MVWNIFYFSIYWECHHPNWRTHIFRRGRSTTNQIYHDISIYPGISIDTYIHISIDIYMQIFEDSLQKYESQLVVDLIFTPKIWWFTPDLIFTPYIHGYLWKVNGDPYIHISIDIYLWITIPPGSLRGCSQCVFLLGRFAAPNGLGRQDRETVWAPGPGRRRCLPGSVIIIPYEQQFCKNF